MGLMKPAPKKIIAEILSLSERQVERLISDKTFEPVAKDGRAALFDIPACVKNYIEKITENEKTPENKAADLVLTEEKIRTERARAEKLEIEVAQTKGELIDIDGAVAVTSAILHTVRNRLLSLPRELALEVSTIDPNYLTALETAYERSIYDALNELSAMEIKENGKGGFKMEKGIKKPKDS